MFGELTPQIAALHIIIVRQSARSLRFRTLQTGEPEKAEKEQNKRCDLCGEIHNSPLENFQDNDQSPK